jgi:hypothetical protein
MRHTNSIQKRRLASRLRRRIMIPRYAWYRRIIIIYCIRIDLGEILKKKKSNIFYTWIKGLDRIVSWKNCRSKISLHYLLKQKRLVRHFLDFFYFKNALLKMARLVPLQWGLGLTGKKSRFPIFFYLL